MPKTPQIPRVGANLRVRPSQEAFLKREIFITAGERKRCLRKRDAAKLLPVVAKQEQKFCLTGSSSVLCTAAGNAAARLRLRKSSPSG